MMATRKLRPTMTDVLRTAIVQSGLSQYRITQDTGVNANSLSRFMRGQTSLRLDVADVLAEYFGLALVKRKAK
jgi:plasmid maintenance system antidote protein VapI